MHKNHSQRNLKEEYRMPTTAPAKSKTVTIKIYMQLSYDVIHETQTGNKVQNSYRSSGIDTVRTTDSFYKCQQHIVTQTRSSAVADKLCDNLNYLEMLSHAKTAKKLPTATLQMCVQYSLLSSCTTY